MADAARYAFELTSFNELRGLADSFQLFVCVKPDGSEEVEIWASKSSGEGKRRFLARTHCPTVSLKDIKAGGKLSMLVVEKRISHHARIAVNGLVDDDAMMLTHHTSSNAPLTQICETVRCDRI